MKILAFSKKFIFAIFAVLFGVNLWGQAPKPTLSLLYPEAAYDATTNPYVVTSAEDWNTLASDVMAGYSYFGKVIKLTKDIEVSTMVGGDADYYTFMYFCGTFDGDSNKLTFNYTGTNLDNYIAPFYYTKGATIKNLKVDGTINTSHAYAAGLIYYSEDEYLTNVKNVTVSVFINAADVGHCGGFAIYSGSLSFENCVYNGKIVADDVCGGFTADEYYGKTSSFTNCIFNPAGGSSITSGYTFGPVDEITNCYYTMQVGSSTQGTLAYKSVPSYDFVKKVTVNGNDVYGHVGVALPNVNTTYAYTGSAIAVDLTIYFVGASDITTGDYSVTVTKDGVASEVKECGEYVIVVAGTGKGGYYGSYSKTFYVVGDFNGSGTLASPFQIGNAGDWYSLSYHVNNGDTYTDSEKVVHQYSEAYYKLTANITVSTMVGTSEHPFKGTFDGQIGSTYGANTLTFNYGTSAEPTTEEIVAPFRYTDGATIKFLIIDGAVHTDAGKESGLIGVNNRTSSNTAVSYIVNNVDLYCYQTLWDAEGGGYAYDGSGISFAYCSYEGMVSANNYHGGFCGNADSNTTFDRCLFDPESGGVYWAENFVYNYPYPDLNYSTCYYTLGNNQEESTQGVMVYVNDVPDGSMGHKITTFHDKEIYEPVTVVISGVNYIYIYNNDAELLNISNVGVTFDGADAIDNGWCTKVITNDEAPLVSVSSVTALGNYTLTITGVDNESAETNKFKYKGTITQAFYVVEASSSDWTRLQQALNASGPTITIDLSDYITSGDVLTAGFADQALSVDGTKTVTINLQGKTIDRGLGGNSAEARTNGYVLKIGSNATVIINGPGVITGGYNKAANTSETPNNDGGGINNRGNLTLNNITVQNNRCVKSSANNTSRTARGGGIYSGKGSTLAIYGCEITQNEAEGGGGGIFAYQAANFTMDIFGEDVKPNVHSNLSKDKGGGIRVDASNATTAYINNCIINNNAVEYLSALSVSNGGGIHLDAGEFTMNNCVIKNNRASKFGGGIYVLGGRLNVNNDSILYNFAYDEKHTFEGCGGGICLLGGKCYINGGAIMNNSSNIVKGGGIYVNSGTTLDIRGNVNITANWKYDQISGTDWSITNVHFVNSNQKIVISGSIDGSLIGVSKHGDTGVFTQGLSGNGTVANFESDNSEYVVVSNSGEAKIAKIEPETPPTTGVWTINTAMILNTEVGDGVTRIEFGTDGCLYVNPGGYINTDITNTDVNKLIINGGQVIPTNVGVYATVKKDIGYALPTNHHGWYLISSPLVTPTYSEPVVYNPISITDNTNLVAMSANNSPEFNLYRFNEGATVQNTGGYELQWENYWSHNTGVGADFTTLQKGRGYLYRNKEDYTITMTGVINVESSVTCRLTNTATVNSHSNVFRGFNIIGNPYAHNIYKGAEGSAIPNGDILESNYYVLDVEDGSWDVANDGTAIPPVSGILVQAKSMALEEIDFEIANTENGASARNSANNIWFAVANSKYEDRACVEFKVGHGLNKIAHINENIPMLYIRHNDEDFASVDMNPEAAQINLCFEAMEMGLYTLKVQPQGEYNYLHLIDKLANIDIDLLEESEYSFVGSHSDAKDRFVVCLKNQDIASGNPIFAYQSGNDIIVSGEGVLQVFDIMGRLVAHKHVNGVETIEKPSQSGVYILRLNEKTQKIVIR